jgi:hypothetical protein
MPLGQWSGKHKLYFVDSALLNGLKTALSPPPRLWLLDLIPATDFAKKHGI